VSRAAVTQKAAAQIDPASVGFQGVVTPMMLQSPQFQAHLAYLARRQQAGAGVAASGATAAASVTALDTLANYAAKCDGATGIHVPSFNCNAGYEIPQGTIQTGMTNVNIGITGGTRTENVAQQTITAGGTGIGGTSDQLFFAHKSMESDGSVDVKVSSLTSTPTTAKVGIMARVSTAANSANVMIAITPGSGVLFQRRLTNGATTTTTTLTGRVVPAWLRLVRSGNSFSAFTSPDRFVWTQVGSAVTISGFGNSAMFGLAVTAGSSSATATAVFDQFAFTRNPVADCDSPNSLHGFCDPGSRFQVLAETPEAVVVANCRRQGGTGNMYGDVAVIQLNQFNGAMCFYQAYGVDGSNMTAPLQGNTPPWIDPGATHAGGCSACHDNGGLIRSPYLRQTGLLPAAYTNKTNPLKYVGADWAQDKSWSISTSKHPDDTGSNCNSCHRQGVSNFHPDDRPLPDWGTASRFAVEATKERPTSFKRPHSPTSPIWMRPGQITYNWAAEQTAMKYQACAWGFWGYDSDTGDQALSNGFSNGLSVSGCTFTPLATAWTAPLNLPTANTALIGTTVGSRTTSGTVHTLRSAGGDIYGTSDQFIYAYGGPIGDGTATVKVNSLTDTHDFAKAGLMWRDGVAGGAMNAMVGMTPSGATFQYRTTTGGTTTPHNFTGHNFPKWLRLAKAANTYVGYASTDQNEWTQIGPPVTITAFNPGLQSLVGLAVSSHDTSLQATGVFDHFSWLPPSPSTLVDANIAITGGKRSYRNGTHTVIAAGADIEGTSDQFHYSFKGISFDTTISARVASLGATHAWAKAGVMFRNGSADNAPYVLMAITPSSGAVFQYRSTTGGSSNVTVATGHAPPKYVRIVRAGNTFAGAVSSNGSSWTQVGSTATITGFGSATLAGLAVTSHNTSSATTATFTNVITP
jgi:hypothetical protein